MVRTFEVSFGAVEKVLSKVTVCHSAEVKYLFAAMEDNSNNKKNIYLSSIFPNTVTVIKNKTIVE